MKIANATNLDGKSGEAQWRACPERSRRGPAFSFCPSDLTHPKKSHRPPLCHPERTPDFLLRCSEKQPRMRLSLKKAPSGSPKPLSLTGNPEVAEGSAVLFPPPTLLELFLDRAYPDF